MFYCIINANTMNSAQTASKWVHVFSNKGYQSAKAVKGRKQLKFKINEEPHDKNLQNWSTSTKDIGQTYHMLIFLRFNW